jgi:hypothetical protein
MMFPSDCCRTLYNDDADRQTEASTLLLDQRASPNVHVFYLAKADEDWLLWLLNACVTVQHEIIIIAACVAHEHKAYSIEVDFILCLLSGRIHR